MDEEPYTLVPEERRPGIADDLEDICRNDPLSFTNLTLSFNQKEDLKRLTDNGLIEKEVYIEINHIREQIGIALGYINAKITYPDSRRFYKEYQKQVKSKVRKLPWRIATVVIGGLGATAAAYVSHRMGLEGQLGIPYADIGISGIAGTYCSFAVTSLGWTMRGYKKDVLADKMIDQGEYACISLQDNVTQLKDIMINTAKKMKGKIGLDQYNHELTILGELANFESVIKQKKMMIPDIGDIKIVG
ncbi:hypothetical protein COV93_01585 [Candidatus Woesearchaeota archaeon CG11_big_fil_rev_8_21_14_0_20_43_8]|nr:MAG: hypothetical protein COV93_01585 [Candidatus Woesearchaeota archaeon CG11_big_fil_rev_8_21_14_0_20_43_8]PIO06576.1 MAG: hypothetical protein COT47_03325 [Candidatus Woesearchaeota archaeon CG08_land_8_20_14_0_20_43_7]